MLIMNTELTSLWSTNGLGWQIKFSDLAALGLSPFQIDGTSIWTGAVVFKIDG